MLSKGPEGQGDEEEINTGFHEAPRKPEVLWMARASDAHGA